MEFAAAVKNRLTRRQAVYVFIRRYAHLAGHNAENLVKIVAFAFEIVIARNLLPEKRVERFYGKHVFHGAFRIVRVVHPAVLRR